MNQVAMLMEQIKKLSHEEQRDLNKRLVANLNLAAKIASVAASSKFNVRDIVQFDGGARNGIVTMRITGFSRDMAKIKGTQLSAGRVGCNWQVSAKLVFEPTPAAKEFYANK